MDIEFKHSDFSIGKEFRLQTETIWYRCTDVGTRTIIAIALDYEDERNYNGPPYGVKESVFDEYDIEMIEEIR